MSMFKRQIVNTEHPYQCLKTGFNKKRLESSSITRDYKRSSIKSVPKSDNNPPFPVSRITLSLEYEKKKIRKNPFRSRRIAVGALMRHDCDRRTDVSLQPS